MAYEYDLKIRFNFLLKIAHFRYWNKYKQYNSISLLDSIDYDLGATMLNVEPKPRCD